jgi:hypothetical protein
VVERGRYDELGMLMIVTTILGLVLPIITVLVFKPRCTGDRRGVAARLEPVAAFSKIERSEHTPRQEERICAEDPCGIKRFRPRPGSTTSGRPSCTGSRPGSVSSG